MLKKIVLLLVVAGLAVLLAPSDASAYGAAHVGYTHVGPNGVYHAGATEVRGPGGAYGGAYHEGGAAYGGAYREGYGGAAGGYHYSAGYAGGAAVGEAHYGYVR
jgi:hypothetical protein